MKRATTRSMFLGAAIVCLAATAASAQPVCGRTIKADVVALDQAFYNNRLGAIQAGGMIFALRRDVVSIDGPGKPLLAGKVMLRPDKRPRPLVLRMNVDDCLEIQFQNLLCLVPSVFNANTGNQQYPVKAAAATSYTPNQNSLIIQGNQTAFDALAGQTASRLAGVHVMGLELVRAESPPGTPVAAVSADGSWVGANDAGAANPLQRASGLVGPSQRMTYTFVAKAEGAYLLFSTAGNVGAPVRRRRPVDAGTLRLGHRAAQNRRVVSEPGDEGRSRSRDHRQDGGWTSDHRLRQDLSAPSTRARASRSSRCSMRRTRSSTRI